MLSVAEDWTIVARFTPNAPGANQTGMVLGLVEGGTFNNTTNNGIFFRTTAGDASIVGVVDDGGSETTRDSGVDADGTEVTVRIEIRSGGTDIAFYINGSKISTSVTSGIPSSTTLSLQWGMDANASGGAYTDHLSNLIAWREA